MSGAPAQDHQPEGRYKGAHDDEDHNAPSDHTQRTRIGSGISVVLGQGGFLLRLSMVLDDGVNGGSA
jgi:hypothetical protein